MRGTAEVGYDQGERLQIALDKLVGVTHEVKMESGPKGLMRATQGAALPEEIKAFDGLHSANVAYTGDSGVDHIMRAMQVVNGTTSFASALANAENKKLLADYAPKFHWSDLVTSITSPPDFRLNTRVRLRYVADLPDIAEDEVFEETTGPLSDEAVTFSII